MPSADTRALYHACALSMLRDLALITFRASATLRMMLRILDGP